MVTKQAAKNTSMLLKYIRQTRQHNEEDALKAKSMAESKSIRQNLDILMWEVDTAHKYHLTISALEMINALMSKPYGPCVIEKLPGTGIWMTLDNPLQPTDIFFSCLSHAASSYADHNPKIRLTDENTKMAMHPWRWDMTVYVRNIDPDLARGARSFAYWYNAHDQQWTLSPAMQDPNIGCRTGCELISTQNQWPSWYICDECRSMFNFYTSFFPIALMAVNGDFAETEERQELPQFTEQETRKIRRSGSGKYDEVPVTHTYHIVSFDMSVKKHASSHTPQSHESDGPTWLEQVYGQ
jgi:hypothetical protein